MPTYTDCPPEVFQSIKTLIKDHYPDLQEAKVTIHALFAHARKNEDGEPVGPALRFGNYPAAAIIHVNSLKDRKQGKKDATIEIDGDEWTDRSEAEQVGILDHELRHLEVKRKKPTKKDPGGYILTDDCGRPKLRCQEHDFSIGGFYDIVERYKTAALEYQGHVNLTREFYQRQFNFNGA